MGRGKAKGAKRMWERVCNAIVRSGAVTLYVTSEEDKTASLARILNATIVKNGVDVLATLPDCERLLTGGIRLFFMGWIAPKKGIENLQQAMNPSDEPTITLTLCGTGDKKYASSLKERARKLDLLGRTVHFEGHV